MVSARINDGGSVQLMLDTGASRTVISPNALTSLGISHRDARRGTIRGVTGEAEVLAVRVDSIDVNGARHGPLVVVSHDTGFGRGDGLLGRDFLDHFLVTIDNAAGVVTLRPAARLRRCRDGPLRASPRDRLRRRKPALEQRLRRTHS